jgi:undecaprenyl-diphosphatase
MIEKLAKQLAGTSMGSIVLADGTINKAAPAPIIALAAAIFGLLFFATRFSQAVDSSWDRELLLWLNSFAASRWYVWELAGNSLFRGFPVFFSLVALWFADSKERRSRMLAGLLATCVAIALSLWMQFHLANHTRPFLDPAIPLNIADQGWILDWDRRGSFPSDTATVFFALATVIFLENRLVGLFCLFWVAVIIAIPRVIFGWHYPTDIVGSLALGVACVLCFNTVHLRTLFERTLILFERRMYIVHALLFIFLAEAFETFLSLHKLAKIH